MNNNDALLMFYHQDSPRIQSHFDRLKTEIIDIMPAFLVRHRVSSEDTIKQTHPDILVDDEKMFERFPHRSRERILNNVNIACGYLDLVIMTAANDLKVQKYSNLWLLECDVDFSGDWKDFFYNTIDVVADLVATRIFKPHEIPKWSHWQSLRYPARVKDHSKLSAFFPISRISRKLINTYVNEIQDKNWGGNLESMLPTIACHNNLSYRDLLRFKSSRFSGASYGYRPVRNDHYFFEDPKSFEEPNMIYHPVKIT